VRVAWVVAKGAATYARYFLSCSVYREQIIVVFRVTASLPDWKCSPFLTDFLVSVVRHAFGFQAKRAANGVDSAFRLGNTFEFYLQVHIYSDTSSFELSLGSRVRLEKLAVAQLLRKFSVIYGMRVFVIVFTRARHWFLVSSKFNLILLSHLLLALGRGIFHSDIPITNFKYFLLFPRSLHVSPITFFFVD
jgi:hypothetical protein